MIENWGTVIAAIIALIGSLYGINVNMKQKNVDEERAKWRERMRELGRQIVEKAYLLGRTKEEIEKDKIKAELLGLISELQLRLNPFDKKKDEQKGFYDRQILKLAMKIQEKPCCCYIFSFEKKMQLLLKWEWERAKKDSSLFSFVQRYGTHQEGYKAKLSSWGISISIIIFLLGLVWIFLLIYICFKIGVKNG